MKGKFFRACLLLCCLPLGAAGQNVPGVAGQIQFQQFQPGQTLLQFGTQAGKPEVMPEQNSDMLAFVDGSALHGQLAGMDLEHGVTWAQPQAKNLIRFRPAHLDFIRFAHAQSVSVTPTCHLWFANGDDLYGSITSLDNEKLGVDTWFGGAMVIPRAAVRAITLLSANYAVVYEGPYDPGGWVVVNNSPKSWSFRDGAFIGTGPGTLGRELNLTNSATMEFDLAWSGAFALEAGIYCDPMGRQEFNGGACVVNLTPRQVSLNQFQSMRAGNGFNLANAAVPGDEGQSKMHVAIECDKQQGTVSVFINHVLVKTWKDFNFGSGSTGVVFTQRYMLSSSTLKLTHLKISQWQGRSEPETASVATNTDAIHFVNHDRAVGKIESIQNGKVRLALGTTVLDIPLERVTQMEFAAPQVATEPASPWLVRAHFPGGGSLSFQLEKWDDKGISGQSAIFGALAFQPHAVREMEFNLNHSKEQVVAADNKEFEELDE
jgi:hypothetical protein